jgi:hypothetical protein
MVALEHLSSDKVRSCKMGKMTIIKATGVDGVEVDHAIIEHSDGSFTSMLKSTYEAQQAEQSTPILPE